MCLFEEVKVWHDYHNSNIIISQDNSTHASLTNNRKMAYVIIVSLDIGVWFL